MAKCRAGKAPIHEALRAAMAPLFGTLITKAREVEDAEDALIDAVATSEAAEEAFEDTIRNIDDDLERADRETPELNAQKTVFPEGFREEIEPDGDEQRDVLPNLKTRLANLSGHPVGPALLAALLAVETPLQNAFKAQDVAEELVYTLFAEEVELVDDEKQHPSPQVDEVTVTLQANDARLLALIAILDRHAIPWLDEGLTDALEA